eukprot:3349296-Prorocentrum_lima.AAC.1
MTSSLVGSEMCIRDRRNSNIYTGHDHVRHPEQELTYTGRSDSFVGARSCLLYTSDAADDM